MSQYYRVFTKNWENMRNGKIANKMKKKNLVLVDNIKKIKETKKTKQIKRNGNLRNVLSWKLAERAAAASTWKWNEANKFEFRTVAKKCFKGQHVFFVFFRKNFYWILLGNEEGDNEGTRNTRN